MGRSFAIWSGRRQWRFCQIGNDNHRGLARADPEIEIVSRDRGGGYGEEAAKALPMLSMMPIADICSERRGARFFDAVHKSMRWIRMCDRSNDNQARAAHLRGEAPIRRLSPA